MIYQSYYDVEVLPPSYEEIKATIVQVKNNKTASSEKLLVELFKADGN